jgi:hypothetical protein
MLQRILLLLVLCALPAGCSQDKTPPPKTASEAPQANHPPLNTSQPPSFVDKADKVFDRVNSVLSGYRAYRGQAPGKLADLDQGDYMFDSQYLADIVPADSLLYLELTPELDGTRLWLETSGEARVASRYLTGTQIETLDKTELQKIKSSWQTLASVGRLTQVKR